MTAVYRTLAELEDELPGIAASPADDGRLDLIVRRPASNVREVLDEGQLDPAQGLAGDAWRPRSSPRTPDPETQRETQLTLMNSRVIAAMAGDVSRWPLAGDQLFVDLELGAENLPPGTRLAIGGQAVIEIATVPHTGCAKFAGHFGVDALKFINGSAHRARRLRGVYAKVVRAGVVRAGDRVTRLA